MTEEEIAAADRAQFAADRVTFTWRWGWQLGRAAKKEALATFTNRHTAETPCEHKRATGAAITFETDDEWLRKTRFAVLHGRLDPRADHCVNIPAFPRHHGLWRLPEEDEKKSTEVLTNSTTDLTSQVPKPENES